MVHEETKELRFVERSEPMKGHPNLVKTIKVLQQKWLDGWGKSYWKDVPTVKEEDE
ncbi:MAG: hypothetical protein IID16_01005 [Candidatus Marinimicrobia bacterium]|nr:hypothetical protein [Candidatus Neomarinimicrobiota bacterium]